MLGKRWRSLRQASLGALTHTAPQMEITALVGCLRGEGLIITAPAEAVGYRWVGVAGAAQPLPKESEVPQASCACQAFTLPPSSPPSPPDPPPPAPGQGCRRAGAWRFLCPRPFTAVGGCPRAASSLTQQALGGGGQGGGRQGWPCSGCGSNNSPGLGCWAVACRALSSAGT